MRISAVISFIKLRVCVGFLGFRLAMLRLMLEVSANQRPNIISQNKGRKEGRGKKLRPVNHDGYTKTNLNSMKIQKCVVIPNATT